MKESLFTFSRSNLLLHSLDQIYYRISQQTHVINVLSTFQYLTTRIFFVSEANDTTFFTLLRQQISVNIFQISSSQKINVTHNVI